jgi:heptosyltransferase-2
MQPEKSWPLRYFAQAVESLHKSRSARFFITGGPEGSLPARTLMGLVKAPVHDLCGKTSLMELCALLARLDLFITVDTGSAHLAALAGCPLITVYTASNPLLWTPLGPAGKRLFCYDLVLRRYGIPKTPDVFESMPYVRPEDVVEAAGQLLDGLPAGGA